MDPAKLKVREPAIAKFAREQKGRTFKQLAQGKKGLIIKGPKK